jgi:hypothetical protein
MNIQLREDIINSKICIIRNEKVLLDRDLAAMYGVETRVLKQAVRRNMDRFPEDFMFELADQEFEDWKSQNVMSNGDKMGLRYRPMAFTEQGVAMLSAVLKSKTALEVNIAIIRAFVKLRKAIAENEILAQIVKQLELETMQKIDQQDEKIDVIFESIKQLAEPEPIEPRKQIGYKSKVKK